MNWTSTLSLLGAFCLFFSPLMAQKTVQFRISQVYSNVDDMDGWGSGDSDPQWDFEITDAFGTSDDDNREFGGTNCPGWRTINNTFFSQVYDCEIPSFTFVWRGFEDDGFGSDANTGYRTISIPVASLNLNQTSFTTINTYTATASGDPCGSGSTVTWRITLQYRITGGDLCKDECSDPYVLPTAPEYECNGTQSTMALNVPIRAREPADASQNSHSTAGISCDIDGSSPEDVWVRTTIPDSSGGVIIQFENNGGCSGFACYTNIAYAWYTSSNGSCSGLQYRGCDAVSCFIGCSDGEIRVDGRANEDVWVRIWEEDDQGFDITINQIQPIAPADRCYTAMPLSALGCNYQATSDASGPYAEPDISSWTAGAHPGGLCQDGDSDPGTNTVWSSNENMVWYTFDHTGGPFNIAVDNMLCTGGAAAAQLGVFSNSGTAASPSCDLASETGYGCSVGVGAVQLSIASLPPGNFVLVVDGNAGAQCDWVFRETINGPLLPIRLKEFEVDYQEATNSAKLDWALEFEENQEGFTVQRSFDAIDFEDIDFIPAYGSSELDSQYEYVDQDLPNAQVLYYRLRQEMTDGSYRHTNIKSISPVQESGVSLVQELYPNPARDAINIPFHTISADEVSIQIYDINGRLIKTVLQNQEFEAGYQLEQVDISDFPNGVYVLRFSAGQNTVMKRFVVQK